MEKVIKFQTASQSVFHKGVEMDNDEDRKQINKNDTDHLKDIKSRHDAVLNIFKSEEEQIQNINNLVENQNPSNKTTILEKLKGLGSTILGGFFLIVIFSIPILFIWGGIELSVKIIPWLYLFSGITLIVNIIVFLPMALIRKTRGWAGLGIYFSSFIFGINLWFLGLLITYFFWGALVVFIGLFFMGIGVVPIGILASIFNGEWEALGVLIGLIALTFGTRIAGLSIANHS